MTSRCPVRPVRLELRVRRPDRSHLIIPAALTFRVWIIGLLLSTLLASINSFLYYRSPAPNLSSTLGILLAYPLGKLAAAVLPITTQTCPAWLPFIGGARWSFNPCPFNIKEHGLITMMISVSNISAYGLQAPIAAAKYYSVTFPVGFVRPLAARETGPSRRSAAPVLRRRLTLFPLPVASRSLSFCRRRCRVLHTQASLSNSLYVDRSFVRSAVAVALVEHV